MSGLVLAKERELLGVGGSTHATKNVRQRRGYGVEGVEIKEPGRSFPVIPLPTPA